MTTMTSRTGAAIAFALMVAASMAAAQQPPTVRVRGTIESVDGQVINVKGRDGAAITVKLADNAPVRTLVKMSLADEAALLDVGITAMPQPDGTQKAVKSTSFRRPCAAPAKATGHGI